MPVYRPKLRNRHLGCVIVPSCVSHGWRTTRSTKAVSWAASLKVETSRSPAAAARGFAHNSSPAGMQESQNHPGRLLESHSPGLRAMGSHVFAIGLLVDMLTPARSLGSELPAARLPCRLVDSPGSRKANQSKMLIAALVDGLVWSSPSAYPKMKALSGWFNVNDQIPCGFQFHLAIATSG